MKTKILPLILASLIISGILLCPSSSFANFFEVKSGIIDYTFERELLPLEYDPEGIYSSISLELTFYFDDHGLKQMVEFRTTIPGFDQLMVMRQVRDKEGDFYEYYVSAPFPISGQATKVDYGLHFPGRIKAYYTEKSLTVHPTDSSQLTGKHELVAGKECQVWVSKIGKEKACGWKGIILITETKTNKIIATSVEVDIPVDEELFQIPQKDE